MKNTELQNSYILFLFPSTMTIDKKIIEEDEIKTFF